MRGQAPIPARVGASLLAKNSQAPRSFRKHALSLTFFASKLAPTECMPLPHLDRDRHTYRSDSRPLRFGF
ncbi:hypothetical protein FHP26_25390 [Pseudomonas orientalis]|nr:hypothetical protein [Pseudomonas orientalis]